MSDLTGYSLYFVLPVGYKDTKGISIIIDDNIEVPIPPSLVSFDNVRDTDIASWRILLDGYRVGYTLRIKYPSDAEFGSLALGK